MTKRRINPKWRVRITSTDMDLGEDTTEYFCHEAERKGEVELGDNPLVTSDPEGASTFDSILEAMDAAKQLAECRESDCGRGCWTSYDHFHIEAVPGSGREVDN